MEKRLLNIYIQALYLSAHKIEGIEIITESLKQFDMALQENPEFEKMLLSRSVTPEKKKEIVKLFEGKISQEVINLLYVIITKSRCFIIPHLLHEWTEKLKKKL